MTSVIRSPLRHRCPRKTDVPAQQQAAIVTVLYDGVARPVFAKAMDVSCHSFVRMARLAAPLMENGGTMFAMSYYGANRVVPNYNVMGPVKAALDAACRYLAYELGPRRIRVHAISPGPLKTRAASGLKDFELLLNEATRKAPLGELVDIMDVGYACAYLATPFAHRITGGTVYVDGGTNIIA
jgi:enoyl-[acyl-carrier protein] reductase I